MIRRKLICGDPWRHVCSLATQTPLSRAARLQSPYAACGRPSRSLSCGPVKHQNTDVGRADKDHGAAPSAVEESRAEAPSTTPSDARRSRERNRVYESLQANAASSLEIPVAKQALELLQQYKEAPNQKLYGALILVNIKSETGSAAEVARLLQEMAEEGIQPDNAVYDAALKALAVHPDALLRGQLLEEMKFRWYNLSRENWHDIVAGYVREGQLEMALEKLAEMRDAKVGIEDWLYDMTIFMLCEANEIDGALALMQERVDSSTAAVNAATWFYLFDLACEQLHLKALRYVWRRQISSEYQNPTTGQCMQVLNAAARGGDIELAREVFAKLQRRGVNLESLHYELLMQAYDCHGDVKGIISITSIMAKAGIALDERALERLSHFLNRSPEHPKKALALMTTLSKNRKIPTATFNCVIEASIVHGNLEEAIEIYKELHQVCTDGPDVNTFNTIFRGCRRQGGKDEAMFFAAEMLALRIQPNAMTYDRLLLVCLQDDDYEDAYRYYLEMREMDYFPRAGTWLAMVKRLASAGDERVWGLLETMKEAGLDTEAASRRLHETWKGGAAGDSGLAQDRRDG